MPAALPDRVRATMEACWAQDPERRPTFADVAARLRTVCVGQGTLAVGESTKLPLGPDARDPSGGDDASLL